MNVLNWLVFLKRDEPKPILPTGTEGRLCLVALRPTSSGHEAVWLWVDEAKVVGRCLGVAGVKFMEPQGRRRAGKWDRGIERAGNRGRKRDGVTGQPELYGI